jgi:hypothetical protein
MIRFDLELLFVFLLLLLSRHRNPCHTVRSHHHRRVETGHSACVRLAREWNIALLYDTQTASY